MWLGEVDILAWRFSKNLFFNQTFRPHCGGTATYVGQTGRLLNTRLKEHRAALTNARPERSAVAEHAIDTGHTIDWGNMPFFWQRCTMETWHMGNQPNPLNRKASCLMCMMDSSVRTPLPPTRAQNSQQQ